MYSEIEINVTEAIHMLMSWDLSEDEFAETVMPMANLMAGLNSDEISYHYEH
jgi:hypothetical protein